MTRTRQSEYKKLKQFSDYGRYYTDTSLSKDVKKVREEKIVGNEPLQGKSHHVKRKSTEEGIHSQYRLEISDNWVLITITPTIKALKGVKTVTKTAKVSKVKTHRIGRVNKYGKFWELPTLDKIAKLVQQKPKVLIEQCQDVVKQFYQSREIPQYTTKEVLEKIGDRYQTAIVTHKVEVPEVPYKPTYKTLKTADTTVKLRTV